MLISKSRSNDGNPTLIEAPSQFEFGNDWVVQLNSSPLLAERDKNPEKNRLLKPVESLHRVVQLNSSPLLAERIENPEKNGLLKLIWCLDRVWQPNELALLRGEVPRFGEIALLKPVQSLHQVRQPTAQLFPETKP